MGDFIFNNNLPNNVTWYEIYHSLDEPVMIAEMKVSSETYLFKQKDEECRLNLDALFSFSESQIELQKRRLLNLNITTNTTTEDYLTLTGSMLRRSRRNKSPDGVELCRLRNDM